MVVDDSSFIRGFYSKIFGSEEDVEVAMAVGSAEEAINVLSRKEPEKYDVDVIILDVNMEGMSGIEALPKILKLSDAKVIMSSSTTASGAKETVEALKIGAADYVQKPSSETDTQDLKSFVAELILKVRELGRTTPVIKKGEGTSKTKSAQKFELHKGIIAKRPNVIAIGSSTGGPQALITLFKDLKDKKFLVPVLITQHMPANFTTQLAKQISEVSGHECREGVDGEKVEAGRIYMAPGDYHMVAEKKDDDVFIKLNQDQPENFCRPAVDPMLRSLVEIYGDRILVLILTGMGEDGFRGSEKVIEKGGIVIAQDEPTSVVWGMPGAVAKRGLCSKVEPLAKLAETLKDISLGQIQ